MARIVPCLALFSLLACTPKADGLASEGSEGTTQASGSSEATTQPGESLGESSGSESETETGDEIPPDACPASPVFDSLHGVFDGIESNIDYPEEADWVETCTVSAHAGDLIAGETITLACVTAEGLAVEHVLELQASLVDAEQPTQIPVEVGETLQLTLWSRVWFSGGVSWILRDAEQLDDIRLIYYSTIDLLEPPHAPAPSFVEPLALTLHDDVCETVCPPPEESPSSFVPGGACNCEREQAIEFVLGPDSAIIQNESAGPIGTSMFAFVETAAAYPPTDIVCSDFVGSWYSFLVVSR